MTPAWLRFAYIVEFLLAVPAVFTLWSQVGGQGHLDLMPWYWKLLVGGGAALAAVRMTAAAVERDRAVNRRSAAWFGCLLLLACAMAALTYWAHLQEPLDEDPEPSNTACVPVERALLRT